MRLALCGGLGMRLVLTTAVQRPGNEASAWLHQQDKAANSEALPTGRPSVH